MTLNTHPELLTKRTDLLVKINNIASRLFKVPSLSDGDLQIKDCSGMSNPVFIVNLLADESRKIIIRFFESAAASFDLENKVFANAAEQVMAPVFIESDWKTYRVEEFFNGKPY